MSSDGRSHMAAANVDDPASGDKLDLDRIFEHPAGLRTARHIVGMYIRASQNHDPDVAASTFASVSHPTFDSSPEVATLLARILAFRDAGQARPRAEDRGRAVHAEGSDGHAVAEEAVSVLSSMFGRQNPSAAVPLTSLSPSAVAPENIYPPNPTRLAFPIFPSHAPFQRTSSLPPTDALAGPRSSDAPVHGTESPYHVESPSGRSSAPAMSGQVSGRPGNGSYLPNPESEPLQLDRPSSFGANFLTKQAPAHIQPKPSNTGGYSMPPHARASLFQQIQQPYNSSTAQRHQSRRDDGRTAVVPSANIKNFLPVNKAPLHNGMAAKKDADRPLNNKPAPGLPSHCVAISSAPPKRLLSPHPPTNNSLFIDQMGSAMMVAAKENKRKAAKPAATPRDKRQKISKKKAPKEKLPKEQKERPAAHRINADIWLRIIEFSPPSFLKKVRLFNKGFKAWVDGYDSLHINQRKENFGGDLPRAEDMGLTERQYTDLLGGKGCLECDDKKASRTHWSWAKRWCTDCWKVKIEREDRILKSRQHEFPHRQTLIKLLECIPMGMHDSFMKAHDYIADLESRPTTAPRIYKYYLKAEVDKIIEEYQAFRLPPFKDDPTKSAAENATARTNHQQAEAAAVEKQSAFLTERKAKNDEHMKRVLKIETAIRTKRQEDAQPYSKNRNARRALFLRRAREEIPEVPESFIVEAKHFKAATRIFRDEGTERGWQTLKPKLQKAWDDGAEARRQAAEDAARAAEAAARDESGRNGPPPDRGSLMNGLQYHDRQPERQPSTAPPQHHMGVLNDPHHLYSQQVQLAAQMRARAQDRMHSGIFDQTYGGNGGYSGLNNGASGSVDYPSSLFFNHAAQYQPHHQLPGPYSYANNGLPQIPPGFRQSFPGPPYQTPSGFNPFNCAGSPPRQHAQDGKIPIGSLLSTPSTNAGHHFGGFQ